MKKKLVIVTTDMKIELAMFVNSDKLIQTRDAVEKARERYYAEDYHSESFNDVLSNVMVKYGIEFEIIEHEEI